MEGVEEALCGVLLPVYERGRLEVRAEHERLWGIPADALAPRAGLHSGAKARVAPIAQATAEKYRAHLERAVKTVAAEIEVRGQADLWKHPLDEITDIIYTVVMRLQRRGQTPASLPRVTLRADAGRELLCADLAHLALDFPTVGSSFYAKPLGDCLRDFV